MQEDTRIERDEGGKNLSIGYYIMKVRQEIVLEKKIKIIFLVCGFMPKKFSYSCSASQLYIGIKIMSIKLKVRDNLGA